MVGFLIVHCSNNIPITGILINAQENVYSMLWIIGDLIISKICLMLNNAQCTGKLMTWSVALWGYIVFFTGCCFCLAKILSNKLRKAGRTSFHLCRAYKVIQLPISATTNCLIVLLCSINNDEKMKIIKIICDKEVIF